MKAIRTTTALANLPVDTIIVEDEPYAKVADIVAAFELMSHDVSLETRSHAVLDALAGALAIQFKLRSESQVKNTRIRRLLTERRS